MGAMSDQPKATREELVAAQKAKEAERVATKAAHEEGMKVRDAAKLDALGKITPILKELPQGDALSVLDGLRELFRRR